MQGKATHKRQRLVYIDILEGGWITVQWQCRYALQAQAYMYSTLSSQWNTYDTFLYNELPIHSQPLVGRVSHVVIIISEGYRVFHIDSL